MNKPAETIVTKSEHTVYRIVDSEAVIVEPQNGLVNVVNEVGSRIWELVDGKRSAAQIADIISSEYEISPKTALQDTSEFLNEMAANGLVKLAN